MSFKEFIIANLPAGMSYNEDTARFVVNNKSFFSFTKAKWYLEYITKFGFQTSSFTITLTGLTDGEARPGATIGYTITPDNGTETVEWGSSVDPDAYGTGPNPTDFTAGDGGNLVLRVTDGGVTRTISAPIRYAAGTAPAVADGQSWTVDDTSVNIDASASGANLTFSYTLSGAPAGVTINSGTGAITGTPTAVASGTATVTATDQYGRTLTDTFTFTASLRTAATAANALGPFSFTQDSAITNQDLSADFTLNGNTLTYTVSPSLPAGLSLASNGILSGTPTTLQDATSYTVTGQDEYGRETDSTFTIAVVVDVPAGAIKQRDASYILDRNGNYIEVRA